MERDTTCFIDSSSDNKSRRVNVMEVQVLERTRIQNRSIY